jgi:hypothetical protein
MPSLSATKDWPGGVICIGTSTSVSDVTILRLSQFLVKGAFDRPVFVPRLLKAICSADSESDICTRAHSRTRNPMCTNLLGAWKDNAADIGQHISLVVVARSSSSD